MEKITHQGIVTAVNNNNIEVKILTHSTCYHCLAQAHCCLSEQKEKILTLTTEENSRYEVGERVLVSLSSNNGIKAVVYGYAVPLLLLLTIVIITHYCGYSDFICGISGIIVLIPYYFGLFLLKDKLKSVFQFEIEHYN